MTTQPKPRLNGNSPWGQIDYLEVRAPGIISVSTPGHGGIWVSPELEATLPASVRAIAREYAPAQWYEEDCDCIIPLALLPGIPADKAQWAREYARNWNSHAGRMAPLVAELDRRGL